MGVTDIGLKSEHCFGVVVSGTGEMMARFHWCGTIDVASDWLKKYDSGFLKTAAPSLRNHAGTESNPVDVGRSVSKGSFIATQLNSTQLYVEWS